MRPAVWIVAFAVVVVAGPAHAKDEAARATALFDEGAAHYRAGRFSEAIARFTEAYDLVPEPVLLFNLAKAHEGKGDLPAAITAYERYLKEATDLSDRGAIVARVETLRAQLAARSSLERRAEDERRRRERAEREKERSPSPVPWIIAGGGAAGLVTGIALGAFASGREDDAIAAPTQAAAADLRDEAQGFATGANVAFAIGSALLAGGVTWGVVDVVLSGGSDASPEPSEPVAVRLRVGPGFVGLRAAY